MPATVCHSPPALCKFKQERGEAQIKLLSAFIQFHNGPIQENYDLAEPFLRTRTYADRTACWKFCDLYPALEIGSSTMPAEIGIMMPNGPAWCFFRNLFLSHSAYPAIAAHSRPAADVFHAFEERPESICQLRSDLVIARIDTTDRKSELVPQNCGSYSIWASQQIASANDVGPYHLSQGGNQLRHNIISEDSVCLLRNSVLFTPNFELGSAFSHRHRHRSPLQNHPRTAWILVYSPPLWQLLGTNPSFKRLSSKFTTSPSTSMWDRVIVWVLFRGT
ncbi:hypothetical protein B0H17DRAFT_1137469 [Mycena rosella]|uniref:Uncharacterized protein n=1 Tax=Mycena rosella TaxID=1033263 RepID=A0AAD7GAT7_MYCRO|nr:hypothetical protein B0H17DRAFT_1137469 [Mycena rosella]